MSNIKINIIGKVNKTEDGFEIQIKKEFVGALKNLKGFSHIVVVWWGHLFDTLKVRSKLIFKRLFKKGPDSSGVFATRSPVRPNPVLLSTIKVKDIDTEKGIIYTPFIDAENDTPVLDIKPYFPMERVKNCVIPNWCKHWPAWQEDTITFNWQDEINFKDKF